jgi:hypothetical protein
LIELGFALGRTLAEIEAMPERDIQLYVAYAEKRPLPNRVLELQLAQVSQYILNMASEKNKFKLNDLLLHEKKIVKVMTERDAAIAAGFDVDAYEKSLKEK